jgi:hypothetical protein
MISGGGLQWWVRVCCMNWAAVAGQEAMQLGCRCICKVGRGGGRGWDWDWCTVFLDAEQFFWGAEGQHKNIVFVNRLVWDSA